MMSDHSALKRYCSNESFTYQGSSKYFLQNSKIIIFNKIPVEELHLPRSINIRMTNTSIHSKNEYYESIQKNIQNYRMELLDRIWNPTNMLK